MADHGRYERDWQASRLRLPDLPGWPIQQSGGGFCTTVPCRTEADGGILTHPAWSGPLLSPLSRRLQPLCILVAEGALLRAGGRPLQLGPNSSLHKCAACLQPCQALEVPGQAKMGNREFLDTALQEMVTGPGREYFVFFLFCSAIGSPASGNPKKRAVSFSSGSQEGKDGGERRATSRPSSPSPFTSGQKGPVRGCDAFSRAPCPAVEPGKCHSPHSDPTSERAFLVGSLCSTLLPHCEYVGGSPSPAGTVFEGLASALALENHQTRLCDSVRSASSQVQGHSVYLCAEQRCSCLACRNCGPTGEGHVRAGPSKMKSGFYSPYLILPRKGGGLRPILDLCILNRALHKLHTIGEYIKWLILNRQTDRVSAHNTKSQALFK